MFDEEVPGGFGSGDVVELVGQSGCGKTEILYQVAAGCVLPKRWRGCEVGGREVGVVFFDLDYRFSMLRFMLVMEGFVRKRLSKAFPSTATVAPSTSAAATAAAVRSLGNGVISFLFPFLGSD